MGKVWSLDSLGIDFLFSSVHVILGEVGRGVVVCAGGFGKLVSPKSDCRLGIGGWFGKDQRKVFLFKHVPRNSGFRKLLDTLPTDFA